MLDKDLADSISSKITQELEQLKLLQSASAERIKDEVDRKERETHQLFEQLMLMQVKDQAERDDRRKFWTRFVLGPSGAIAVIVGSVVGYMRIQDPAPTVREQVEQVEQVQQAVTKTVEHRVGDVEASLAKNDEKIKRTVDILLQQQVQLTETTDYIIEKIEKAHPNTRTMEEPPAVTAGRDRADAIKRRSKTQTQYDPANPLAGLE